MSFPWSAIAFGGSRSLPASFAGLVSSVVGSVLAAGGAVRVGCAAGADAAVVASVLSAGAASRLAVSAVGSQSGAGFWSGSAPLALLRSAEQAGAFVSWLAGGSLAVPLRGRLLRRSLACLRFAQVAVFFLASPASPGSLRVAAAAAEAGLPVWAFACGFSGSPAALAGCAGSWVPGAFLGSPCWFWCPAAVQPRLF